MAEIELSAVQPIQLGNPGAATPRKIRFYRPELDALRFVASLGVYLFHASLFTSRLSTVFRACEMGMCVFFTLSSFLITELLLREREKTGRIHIKAFYIRRILRIWPLYFAALSIAVLTGFVVPNLRVPTWCVAAYLMLVGNCYNIFIGSMNSPWSPLWSINLEEQFYFFWTFLSKLGKRAIFMASVSTFPLAWVALTLGAKRRVGATETSIWFNSLVQFQFFGLGALLALLFHHRSIQFGASQRAFAAVASIFLFYVGSFELGGHPQPVQMVLGFTFIVLACASLFLSILGLTGVPMFAVQLGKRSYSLYVFHGPILFFLAAVWQRLFPALPNSPFNWTALCLHSGCSLLSVSQW